MDAFLGDNWSITTNLTLTNGVEEDANGMETPSRHVAPTFGDFRLNWKKRGFRASMFMNFNGELGFQDLALSERSKTFIYDLDGSGNPYSPSWYTLNFRSQYELSDKIRFSFVYENITDQRYRTYSSGIAAPGGNLVLGMGYIF